MTEPKPYPTAAGVEAAIKDAARRAFASDATVSVGEHIRQTYFDRFLCRIFSEGLDSEWLVKGGTGMLARVPQTRATKDVDLVRGGYDLTEALEDLTRLAGIDLGDHFRFVYANHTESVGGEAQPYTEGYRVSFDTYIGVKKAGPVHVDLVVGAGLTAAVSVVEPANRLDLPRLAGHPYRLYPVVDQIADKVCATMTVYPTGDSTREKDLVDIVVLAVTQDIEATALRTAIFTELRRRRLEPFDRFVLPAGWGPAYARMARSVPHCADFATVDSARILVKMFIDPVLSGVVSGTTWLHSEREWK
jgi:hypothetical protein